MSLSSVLAGSGKIGGMTSLPNLDQLPPEQLRALAAQLMQRVESLDQKVETMGQKIHRDQTVIEKLTHEIAQLKRFKFAKRSEQLSPDQASLLDDLIDTDFAAIEAELEALKLAPASTEVRQKPKRTALPPQFPRTLIHHEPDNSHCQCGCALKRIGEDVSEKLDYPPRVRSRALAFVCESAQIPQRDGHKADWNDVHQRCTFIQDFTCRPDRYRSQASPSPGSLAAGRERSGKSVAHVRLEQAR